MCNKLFNIILIIVCLLGFQIFSWIVFFTSVLFETTNGPIKTEYDYIIVGAGTAGTTILSAISNEDVLIIEAGQMASSILDVPVLSPILQRSVYDWSYSTVRQENSCKAMKNHSSLWPMGKGYGGSNIINNMIYVRGLENDYRGWFDDPSIYNFTNDILPFFTENERVLSIHNVAYNTKFMKAFKELKKHSGLPIQIGLAQVTQKNGWRWSMAHYFLNRDDQRHELLLNALVTKVLIDNRTNMATGVEIEKGRTIWHISARKGVILSAGTVGTPKILMLSGIGRCHNLQKHSIPCRTDLPVGENLVDHITTGLDLIRLNTNLGLSPFNLLSPKHLYDFFFNGGVGPLSSVGCEGIGYITNSLNVEGLPNLGLMILPLGASADAGVNLRYSLNIHDNAWSKYFQKLIGTQTASIMPVLLHPRSRGYIRLVNDNPHSLPIINPQYLSHPDDVNILVEGIKIVKRILETESMKKLGAKLNTDPFPGCENHIFDTIDYWNCYVRHLTLTAYHPVGTCRMGSRNDKSTVVTRDFQVKGFKNLFVVDASIMPNLPSGNPNAAVAMIARKFLYTLSKKRKTNGLLNISSDFTLKTEL